MTHPHLSRRGFLRALGLTTTTVIIGGPMPRLWTPEPRLCIFLNSFGDGRWDNLRNWKDLLMPRDGDSVVVSSGRHLVQGAAAPPSLERLILEPASAIGYSDQQVNVRAKVVCFPGQFIGGSSRVEITNTIGPVTGMSNRPPVRSLTSAPRTDSL